MSWTGLALTRSTMPFGAVHTSLPWIAVVRTTEWEAEITQDPLVQERPKQGVLYTPLPLKQHIPEVMHTESQGLVRTGQAPYKQLVCLTRKNQR